MENPVQTPAQAPLQPVQEPTQPVTQQAVPTSQQPPIQQPIQQPTPPIQQAPQTPPASPQPTPSSTPPSSPPSQKGLFIALLLIFLAAIFAAAVYLMKGSSPSEVKTVPTSPTVTQGAAQTDTNKDNSLLPTGTNDTQLDRDIQSIDTKIGTAESDLGNVDQGLNDQSVNLTE